MLSHSAISLIASYKEDVIALMVDDVWPDDGNFSGVLQEAITGAMEDYGTSGLVISAAILLLSSITITVGDGFSKTTLSIPSKKAVVQFIKANRRKVDLKLKIPVIPEIPSDNWIRPKVTINLYSGNITFEGDKRLRRGVGKEIGKWQFGTANPEIKTREGSVRA